MPVILTNYALNKKTGAGKRLKRALLALADAGFDVEYVTVQPPDIKHTNIHFDILTSPTLPENGTPDHQAPGFWIKYMINTAKECLRLTAKKNTACMMAFTFGGAIPMLPAAIIRRTPLIIFVRSDERHELYLKETGAIWRLLFGLLESISVRSAIKIIVNAETLRTSMASRYGNKAEEKIELLRNDLPQPPSDIPACRKSARELIDSSDTFIFTTCAKLHKLKNIAAIIEAMPALKDTNAHLLIIGDGPQLENLKRRAKKIGLEQKTTFAGWRDDATELIAGSDAFIIPSLTEGMSNSLLEALSAEIPCLVSDIPAHREILDNDICFFDPKNTNQLSDKMKKTVEGTLSLDQLHTASLECKNKLSFDWNKEIVSIISDVSKTE